jgi:hypothetical protein
MNGAKKLLEPGSIAEGVQALRENAHALRVLAAMRDTPSKRDDLVAIAGQLRGLALRFERIAGDGS